MQRISQLDGVRGVAIMAVFLEHACRSHPLHLWMGVDLFFILSGFLITGILLNARECTIGQYFARFYYRRARRILPPYVLSLLVTSAFVGFAWTQQWYFYVLLTNLLSPLGIPHPFVFSSLWSLAVEEQFYLIWPFAVYFLSERRLGELAIFLMILAPILRGLVRFHNPLATYELTPFRMDLLAAGALLCVGYRNRRSFIEKWGTSLGVLLMTCGIGGVLLCARLGITTGGNTRAGNICIFESSLLFCLGFILWALSGSGVWVLQSRPLLYIGKISYTMYLMHLAAILVLSAYFNEVEGGSIAFVVTFGYASASWYLMEKPLLAHSHRRRAHNHGTCTAEGK